MDNRDNNPENRNASSQDKTNFLGLRGNEKLVGKAGVKNDASASSSSQTSGYSYHSDNLKSPSSSNASDGDNIFDNSSNIEPKTENGGNGNGNGNNGGKPPVPGKEPPKPEKPKKPKKSKKTKKSRPGLRKFGTVICSILLVFILTGSIVGLYVLKNASDFVNGDVAIDLDEYKANQSQTTIMYTLDDNGNEVELARLHGEENRIWVNLEDIPENLQNAYIALEDKRFKTHSGVDWFRTISVVAVHHFSQGGSTITQQLIKNLTGENGRTFIRKYNEILNALNLEKHFSKDTILETYLNTLYLDGGCYGVQTAAEYYFGKNVSELNLAECASIAAITQEPSTYDPLTNPDKNRERQLECLGDMLEQGLITQEEYNEAKNYKMIFTNSEGYVASNTDNTTKGTEDYDGMRDIGEGDEDTDTEEVQSYYIDYVIDSVIDDLMETRSCSYNEAWRLVYYGGLKIHVAEDVDIQKKMEDMYYNRQGFPDVTNSSGEEVQSCMVIMDYTGRVCGIVGQAGKKTAAMTLNIATGSTRQPGSSIKPLSVYSLAIDSNEYTWSYPYIQNYGILVNGERWPSNYGGDSGSANSYENIQEALAPSHNTVPAQILQNIGVDKSFAWLKKTFHMTSLESSDNDYAPLAVGAMTNGVYALEMCSAYTTFGTSGVYYEPYCYYTVTNSSGSTVYLTHSDEGEQVMSKGTADVMNKLLQTVVTSYDGTGRAYAVSGFDMFAKTGTTTDEKDRWFIGGTPYYVCTVWMGYAKNPEALSFSQNYCGVLYQTIMNSIHKNLPSKSFSYSDELVKRTYCTKTGLLASSSCSSTATGWYKADNIPSTCTSCSGGHSSGETTTAAPAQSTTATETTTAAPTTQAPAADGGDTPAAANN